MIRLTACPATSSGMGGTRPLAFSDSRAASLLSARNETAIQAEKLRTTLLFVLCIMMYDNRLIRVTYANPFACDFIPMHN